MAPRVIEGTWEDIAQQAEALRGSWLRVAIYPDQPSPGPEQSLFVSASPEEFQRAFDALGRANAGLPVLPAEAFEREALYAEDSE